MLLVPCYKQHGTIHDATLLKATVACYNVASCMDGGLYWSLMVAVPPPYSMVDIGVA